VRKAVIPAAGLGTRFLPATKAIPKEMLPIVDTPTIQLIVEEAVAAGIEEIVLVNGRGKSSIEDHFDHAYELEHTLSSRGKADLAKQVERISNLVRIVSVRQKQPLGLGHAVLVARDAIGDEPFAVLLGDDLYDTTGKRPAIGQLVDVFAETKPGKGGEIQLTDALLVLAQREGMIAATLDGERHDAGDRLGYLRANLAYALRRPELVGGVRALCEEMLARAKASS
jgi:UTP-glucose-1-phosphate uridylyltransferase